MSEWELLHGDCREEMVAMPRSSVDAIVTSPPYADQRKYDGTALRATERANRNGRKPGTKNQSRRQRSEAPMRFAADFVAEVLPPMFAVLADHGSLMLNLGVVMRDGEESAYADTILAGAREIGFKLLHRTIWHKPNGNTLSDPRFLRINHEWVFWLAKSTEAYRGYDRETRSAHKDSTLRRIRGPYITDADDERYGKRGGRHALHPDGARPTTIFECGVGGEQGVQHPAVMPLKLARHLVALAAPADALVLDPYAGSGTTGVAAIQLGRRFLGIEQHEAYLPECRERLADAKRSPSVNAEQIALELT